MQRYEHLSRASLERLDMLLEERLSPQADKAAIDERIWSLFGEDWAVMFTDLSGFSRGVAKFGIIHFLQTIYESKRLLLPCIDRYDGILMKTEGDSFLVLYRQAKQAVQSAVEMMQVLQEHNQTKPDEEKVLLCVGLGYGRLLKIGDQDVFGAEVNAASKLGEDTAKAWEILVTDSVQHIIRDTGYTFTKLDTAPPGAKAAYCLHY